MATRWICTELLGEGMGLIGRAVVENRKDLWGYGSE